VAAGLVAGISGLTLAAALARLAPQHEVELYERDASAAGRRRSYAIGLKAETGLAVLERLGLREEVLADGAQQVMNFVITDRQGTALLALPSGRDESGYLPADADRVAAGIAARGRKAVLESRRSAEQFHATSRFQILSRNLGFRVGNAVINSRLTTRKAAVPTTSVR